MSVLVSLYNNRTHRHTPNSVLSGSPLTQTSPVFLVRTPHCQFQNKSTSGKQRGDHVALKKEDFSVDRGAWTAPVLWVHSSGCLWGCCCRLNFLCCWAQLFGIPFVGVENAEWSFLPMLFFILFPWSWPVSDRTLTVTFFLFWGDWIESNTSHGLYLS